MLRATYQDLAATGPPSDNALSFPKGIKESICSFHVLVDTSSALEGDNLSLDKASFLLERVQSFFPVLAGVDADEDLSDLPTWGLTEWTLLLGGQPILQALAATDVTCLRLSESAPY